MHDFTVPFSGYMFRRWRSPVGEHHDNFAAKALLIELERCLAVPVGIKIWIYLHHTLLFVEFYGGYPTCRSGRAVSSWRTRFVRPRDHQRHGCGARRTHGFLRSSQILM